MKIYNLLILIVSFISFFIILCKGELILSLMPLFFILSWIVTRFINNNNIFFTKSAFIVFGIVRLVIIPFIIAITDDKRIDNLPLGFKYFDQGILLIVFEYFIGSLLLLILSKIFKNKLYSRQSFRLAGSKFFYIVFILVVMVIFMAVPSVRETVSFLIIKTNATGRGEEATTGINVLLRMLLQLALCLLFLISSFSAYKKYMKDARFTYLVLPLILGLINVSLIVGERRSIQIYTLVAVLVIITLLFKKHSKKVNIIILSLGAFILISMTLYKELYVFNFSSYSDALNSSNVNNIKFIDQLQSYFYGPHNVAASIAYLHYYDGSFKQLMFDIVRSVFGLNLLIDKSQFITSQLFNQLIYGNKQLTGHLISSAGYGYIYFGPLLFPIVIFTNLLFATSLEVFIRKTDSLEFIFIGTYLYMRVIFSLFGHTIPIMNMGTMILIVYSVVCVISFLAKKCIYLITLR
ncbi:capsular biosynthesis protein [Staphylococcus chromogenes]|nr:capsular biosynthesis protein [Staphylococcus chromogenes]MCE4966140.1 capsular biosynthesis protein [Staphylococcus chromogenes]RIM07216.1 capsular biosynthesis protein [Staphylococcus chromogenes]